MIELREELNLGGSWTLVTDPENRGIRDGWFEALPEQEALSVSVPAVWDLWIPDYDGVGWYCRDFELPSGWEGCCAALCFDAVNYYAEVWVNGVALGSHEGGYTPFSLNADRVLKTGQNRIVVRVIDPKGPEGFGHFLPGELPIAKETEYWSFGGIWGDVYLRRMPETHIEDVFIQPDLRRKRIVVEVAATTLPENARIRLQVEDTEYLVDGTPGKNIINMPDFKMWRLEQPHLYQLRAEIVADDVLYDSLRIRFGMREFTVKDNRFHLNYHPIFLKGVLYQPDYARTLAAPGDEAMARSEIEQAKRAGFNMMRLHIKPAPKIILDLADEMGMLLYEESSIGWIKDSDHMRKRCETSVREMILRDRNRPSVVIWGMLNETGNAGYGAHGGAQTIKDALCRVARSLDPTRVIIDDSAGVNATRESSRMMRPYRDGFMAFDDMHIYQRAPVDMFIRNYYRNSGEPEQLVTVSAFGFGGPEDLEDVLAHYGEERETRKDARFLDQMLDDIKRGFQERGLEKVFGDIASFFKVARTLQCDALRAQIDAMRANTKISGYCYAQLADAGREFCAGFLDRWRRPKPALKCFAGMQHPMRPLIFLGKNNLHQREQTEVTALFANDNNVTGVADLSLQVVGPTNQVLWKKKRSLKIPRHGGDLWRGNISASGSSGTHRFVVRLMQGMKVLAQAAAEFHVYEPVVAVDTSVHLLDVHGEWHDRIAPYAKPDNILASTHIIPPLANTIRAYPDNDMMQVLAQVKGGAIAVFFEPPDDWNDLAALLDGSVSATPKSAVGGLQPVCHYVKLHPLFDKLPSRGIMRQPYANVAPAKTFQELGDEDICGTFDASPTSSGECLADAKSWWGNDLLVRRYGSGRIVFTHLRILEHLGEDPVADRLFVNMLNHFSRRSVPPAMPLPPNQKAVEWLRAEHTQQVRRWMVIGEFPNWNNCSGFDTVYPPENTIDFNAVYPGWYKSAQWRRWYSCSRSAHVLDLQTALAPVFQEYPKYDRSVAYAYAEISAEKRMEIEMCVGYQDATRVWMNNVNVFETRQQVPHEQFESTTVPVTLRQGKNTMLVKCAKIPGPFKFSITFENAEKVMPYIKWWK